MGADESNGLNFEVLKDAYIGCLQKYVVFSGRARRREFWTFTICNFVLSIIPVVGFIVSLLTFIPSMAVGVRRLHDTGRSGKLLLLALVPLVGIIIVMVGGVAALYAGRGSGILLFLLVLVLIASIGVAALFIWWCVQDGTPGDNQYGPNPKETGSAGTAQPGAPVSGDKPKFCGHCGAKNANGAKFCAGCGKPMT